jgi:ArsR family transcriptional regulator, arsenate/arsenite/antimonite-responsive transcriptional repressor
MEKMSGDEAAQIAKALGDPNRLAIYTDLARHEELFCGEMHCNHPISGATLSHHLKVLTDLGLITYRKDGLKMFYRAVPEKFASYLKYLAAIGPQPPAAKTRAGRETTRRHRDRESAQAANK